MTDYGLMREGNEAVEVAMALRPLHRGGSVARRGTCPRVTAFASARLASRLRRREIDAAGPMNVECPLRESSAGQTGRWRS